MPGAPTAYASAQGGVGCGLTLISSRGSRQPRRRRLRSTSRSSERTKTVGDFLTWAFSEVLDSQRRGFVAEFMVMDALGIELDYISGDMYDLRYRGGVQIKASSAVQNWGGALVHRIGFSTRPRRAYTVGDDGLEVVLEAQRRGKCWVFAVHLPTSSDPEEARDEVLDATKWRYWVADPRAIRYDHRTASTGAENPNSVPLLSVIANTGPGVGRKDLKLAIDRVMDTPRDQVPAGWTRAFQLEHWTEEERMHLVPDGAIEAVRTAIDALRLAYPDRLTVGFSPGEVRALRRGDQRVAITLKVLQDLEGGRVRVHRWLGMEPKRSWDLGEPCEWSNLPEVVVDALR